MQDIEFHLRRQDLSNSRMSSPMAYGLSVTAFRYPSGIEALLVENERGNLIVLPFMGQMILGAEFDGVDLTMGNSFSMPRPATTIVETYGCFGVP